MPTNPLARLRPRKQDEPAARPTPRPTSQTAPRTPRYGVDRRKLSRANRTRTPGPLARVVNAWWNRLIGAVFGGGLSAETEQYLAHQTTRDYVCNTAGQAAWGALFPLLTIVCTWLVGPEQAGWFSMAFTVGLLLFFVGNFGARTYQVSDLDELQSFLDYQVSRVITCVVMVGAGWLWCRARGYAEPMASVVMGVVLFRAADALADVFEGRLQQKDKLYLAGISQTVRCVGAGVVFTLVLLITRNLAWACYGMAIAAGASVVLLSAPLAYFETDRSLPFTLRGLGEVFSQCFPLFMAVFMYNLIDSVPKFAMEGALSYDNQLYYNAMFFPAEMILMIAGFIYKPQLVRLARIWESPEKHRRFDLVVLAMVGVIALVTAGVAAFMYWAGVPIMGLMYGLDFAPYTSLALVMVASGGICACIDFLYQIVAVLRAQRDVMRLYLVAFAFAVPVVVLLVNFSGLSGAVVARLVIMAILLLLLVTEYLAIRRRLDQER